MQAQAEEVKGKLRYHYALKFALANLEDDNIPITMTHPLVQRTVIRYRLALPQVRRLVSDLRKERDAGR